MDCEYTISVQKKDAQQIFYIFESLFKVEIKEIEP